METTVQPTFGSVLDANMSVVLNWPLHQGFYTTCIVLYAINVSLCIINITFFSVSWILIKKWRRLQNFVFINLIISSTFSMTGYYLCFHNHYIPVVVILVLLLPRMVICHWLVVANIMFYMQFVKVYFRINRKYLVFSIFSWVGPIVEVSLLCAVDTFFETSIAVDFCNAITLILLLTSGILLFVTILSAFSAFTETRGKSGICGGLFSNIVVIVASGIPSGLTTLLPMVISEVLHLSLNVYGISVTLCMLTITVGYVAFLSFKIHRTLWTEYLRQRKDINNIPV